MRTTTIALISSLAACAPVGGGGNPMNTGTSPDAGSAAAANCDTPMTVTADWNVTSNAAPSNVPNSCYTLAGSLTLSGPNITSLAKLGDIRGVQDLVVDSTELKTIDSVSPIHITGAVTITNNDSLTDITNFQVESSDQPSGITVEFNDALTGLGQLGRAQMITGPVMIDNNGALTTVALQQVQQLQGGISIHDNAVLTTLKLSELQTVTNDFVIKNNAALTSLGSLSSLQSVHGNFIIDTNKALTSLDDSITAPMTSIDLNLQITNNALLTSLGELAHAGRIGGALVVENNADLLYCDAREIGCCVGHVSDTISGNKTNNDNGCAHSWCYAQNGNQCPFQY